MQIFCAEQNYFSNKAEQINGIKNTPLIFIKPYTSLLKEGIAFIYPEFANELYCGCELVLRISKRGKNIDENFAANFYDALTVGINFTAFDNNPESLDEEIFWNKTKAWDNSSAIGKWLPANAFSNKQDMDFCLYKNREMVQLCNSGLMVYNFNKLISIISASYTLTIGDLIFTGSRINIGELLTGDKLEAFIEDDSLLEFEIE
jgi:2-keto-4-pentenoate hydratase/2-oxohepta-3-ene-1,7-dioic acid hydratase in catechol pathway